MQFRRNYGKQRPPPPPSLKKTPKTNSKTFRDYFKPVHYSGRIIGVFHYAHPEVADETPTMKERANSLIGLPFVAFGLVHFALKARYVARDTTLGAKAATIYCFIKLLLDYAWFVYKTGEIARVLDAIDAMSTELRYDFTGKTLKFRTISFFVAVFAFRFASSALAVYPTFDERGIAFGLSSCWNEIVIIAIGNFVTFMITRIVRDFFAEVNSRFKRIIALANINEEIDKSAELHFRLVGIARKLNEAFAFPALGNALAFFMLITVYSYRLVAEIRKFYAENGTNFGGALKFAVDLAWALFLLANLRLMVTSWDELAKEANATGLHVHEIWNKLENGEQTSTTTAKERQIDDVSLRLLQSKLKFTLCRIVDLDPSLIHQILQTVTMYLTWILQLKTQ